MGRSELPDKVDPQELQGSELPPVDERSRAGTIILCRWVRGGQVRGQADTKLLSSWLLAVKTHVNVIPAHLALMSNVSM